MKHTQKWRRIGCLVLAAAMLSGTALPAAAADRGSGTGDAPFSVVEEASGGEKTGRSPFDFLNRGSTENGKTVRQHTEDAPEAESGPVRVSIVLESPSAMEAGYGPVSVNGAPDAGMQSMSASYRTGLR